jgi:hypothetical protein
MRRYKFTFKKEPIETGLAAVVSSGRITNIKYANIEVGWIQPPLVSGFVHRPDWCIWLSVVDETNGGLCNKRLKARFETEPDARRWLQEKRERLIERYALSAVVKQ